MTSTSVEFRLPFPPSTNNVWNVGKTASGGARIIRSKEYRRFLYDVYCLRLARKIPEIVRADRYALDVVLFPDNFRVYDADNRVKAVQDALTAVKFWPDDSLVETARAIKGQPAQKAFIIVRVVVLDESTPRPRPEDFGVASKQARRNKEVKLNTTLLF